MIYNWNIQLETEQLYIYFDWLEILPKISNKFSLLLTISEHRDAKSWWENINNNRNKVSENN